MIYELWDNGVKMTLKENDSENIIG